MEYKLTYRAFKEALRNDKLLGLRCRNCGNYVVPPKKTCRQCDSEDFDIVELSGKGKIRTFTVIHVPPQGFDVPTVVCLVELDEGPWMMGNLANPDRPTMDLIGRHVRLGHKVTPGDVFSAGERVAACFTLVS